MTTVSVIIPTLGRPSLGDAVASANAQGIDVEVVVVDDSEEGAVREFGGPATVIRTPGRAGAAAARNLGMAAARGNFVAFLDDDDVWLPGHLEDALRVFRMNPDADIYASRGLVVGDDGAARVEPSVLLEGRTAAQYFFERPAWRSRCRRLLTPSLVFKARLRDHPMDVSRTVNEDTWWLLTAERDRGARVVQSAHVGVLVHASSERTHSRWGTDLGSWFDDADAIHPGGAAVEQLVMFGRPAVRAGRPGAVMDMAPAVLRRRGGWTWLPALGLHAAAATAVVAWRRIATMSVGHAA